MDGGDLGARFAQQMLELLREQVAAAATANEAVARQAAVSESLARQLEARPQAIAATPARNAAAEEPAQISRIDDPELEASLMELADREGWWHDDADEVLEQFDWMLVGLMTVQEEYVRYCARKGLDPATALPSLARLADGLKATAEATGAALPPPTAIPAAPPAATPQAKAASATAAPGEATRRRSDVPVSAVFDRYFEMKTLGYKRGRPGETICAEAGVKFRQTTLPNMESTMRLIIGVVGDKPLDEITADEWVSFIELLSRMPKAHGKSSKERRTVREIVEDTDREEAQAIELENDRQLAMGTSPNEIDARLARVKVPRLSVTTCVRHMRDAARVIDYAVRHGLVSENRLRPLIWDGEEIRWRERFASSINREPWRDEIYRLFRTPVFQGNIDPDGEDDALFWGPLLGELGGLRLEEALQLRVEDFRTDEGVPFIDVCMGDAAQTMKSHKSWRKIPLHRHLIALGILEFLEAQRSRGNLSLFPKLTRGVTKGRLSENFSKRFTYYRRRHGVYSPRFDFHSFRAGFSTRLYLKLVAMEFRQELMGHEPGETIKRHYEKDPTPIPILKEFVDRIELDISMIRSPFVRRDPGIQAPKLRLV